MGPTPNKLIQSTSKACHITPDGCPFVYFSTAMSLLPLATISFCLTRQAFWSVSLPHYSPRNRIKSNRLHAKTKAQTTLWGFTLWWMIGWERVYMDNLYMVTKFTLIIAIYCWGFWKKLRATISVLNVHFAYSCSNGSSSSSSLKSSSNPIILDPVI